MLATLVSYPTDAYPLAPGVTFEVVAARATETLSELARRTRRGWKLKLLELVQVELAKGLEKARTGDENGAHRLLVDAHLHFRQYEQGVEPRVTFIAGPNGDLQKLDD